MEQQQLDPTGSAFTDNSGSYSKPYLAYWEQVYATTQSAALKQKAATILGIKQEKK